MRKLREILRLKIECQCSNHEIGKTVGVSSSTVSECLRRARDANINWPIDAGIDDMQLEAALYPKKPLSKEVGDRYDVDWANVKQQLQRKGVTLLLLWYEYKDSHSNGMSYSRYCAHYRSWCGQLDVWMRQEHKAGEKAFIDYSGMKLAVIDRSNGEAREAEIFVMALGASSYTYVEATWTQSLPDFISSHVHGFEFFGGVPSILVPDNLKSGVSKADRYEPDLNPSYVDMASHYGVAIIPARVRMPQDKSKVENAVLQVERQILARLRDRTFFSLEELNEAIDPLLIELNERPFQKLPGSRQSQFDTIEKPALRPLPESRYYYAEWKKVRAGADYHIELKRHYYSVPS